jgi:CheY-like chemotaxis protein
VLDKFCILQVEDDRNDVFFLQHAFKAAGITHPLRVVRDGQEAIDYLAGEGEFSDRARHPLPCLILLDLKLPRKDGFEVLEWVRQHPQARQLPVIVLTSSAREADVERACLLGANSFLVKPSELQERVELARLLKGYWLQYHRMPAVCAKHSQPEVLISKP